MIAPFERRTERSVADAASFGGNVAPLTSTIDYAAHLAVWFAGITASHPGVAAPFGSVVEPSVRDVVAHIRRGPR